MVDFSLTDLAQSAGTTTGNFVRDAANQAASYACALHQKYPGWLIGQLDPTGLYKSFSEGLMSQLCSGRPGYVQPSAPTAPFSGGQCPVEYQTFADYSDGGNRYEFSANCWGPVQGYFLQGSEWHLIGGIPGTPYYTDYLASYNPAADFVMKRLVRLDRQPDNCGNPPTSGFPTTSPPSGELNTTVNFNNEPTAIAFVNAEINKGININLGGVDFNFDLNGVTLNPKPSAGLSNAHLSALVLAVANLQQSLSVSALLDASSLNFNSFTPSDSGESEPGTNLKLVELTLTQIPISARTQSGSGSPNVIYAGWFEFRRNGYNFPRQPVHFERGVYASPPGATGYAYTLYQGFKGSIREYLLKE